MSRSQALMTLRNKELFIGSSESVLCFRFAIE